MKKIKYYLKSEKGKVPNTKLLTVLKNGKSILDGENFVPMEKTLFSLEDIKSEPDLNKVKQYSQLWYDLRNDEYVEKIRKNVFKDEISIKTVRASTLPTELGLFTNYVSKQLKLTFSKQEEFRNSLLGKKIEFDESTKVNLQYGTNTEDKVTKAFLHRFNDEITKTTVYETGTHILKDNNVKNIQIWTSPDGLFTIENNKSKIKKITGSWEAKSTSPFFYKKEEDIYEFNPYMKPSSKIKNYYVPQKIVEMYATNSDYSFIGFSSLFNGSTYYLTKKNKKTDRFKELIFMRLDWKNRYYKGFSENDVLKDNPFEHWEYDFEFLGLLNELSEKYVQKFELSHDDFMEGLDYVITKPFE